MVLRRRRSKAAVVLNHRLTKAAIRHRVTEVAVAAKAESGKANLTKMPPARASDHSFSNISLNAHFIGIMLIYNGQILKSWRIIINNST